MIKIHLNKINKKTSNGYGLLFVFLVLGLIVGLIICFIWDLDSYKNIIPFTISISTLIGFLIMKVGKKHEL